MTDPGNDSNRHRVLAQLKAAVSDYGAHELRINCSASVANGLATTGKVIYVSGWLLKSRQMESLGTLAEMAGELALEAVAAYKNQRWYAGAALVRQLIEAEYLVFLISLEPSVAEEWLAATPEKMRKEFTPARMRARANGMFRDKEYWLHCDLGGHPAPSARHLLASHPDPIGSKEIHWLDLAQHLDRLWSHFCRALLSADAFDAVPKEVLFQVGKAVAEWREGDSHREIEAPET